MSARKGRSVWALLSPFVVVLGHAACGSTEHHGDPGQAGSATGGEGGAGADNGGVPGRSGSPPVAGGGAGPMLPPGLSDKPSATTCRGEACESAQVGPIYVDPCCDASGACGLTTSFLALVGAQFEDVCQAHDQPGELSDSCPKVDGLVVPLQAGGTTLMVPLDPFVGCCRPNGACGVVINGITSGGGLLPLADLSLGCVDATPFGGQPIRCDGEAGMGGSGPVGVAGAGGVGPAEAGAPSSHAGGAGGAP